MKEIIRLGRKIVTKEMILYIVFGILTTIVNIGVFYLVIHFGNGNENLANMVAILSAILVAYITNKDLVFHAKAENIKEKIRQFCKFLLGRAFTMVVEFGGGFVLFKTPIPEMISKTFLTIVVIILNFFISKFFAFNTKQEKHNI